MFMATIILSAFGLFVLWAFLEARGEKRDDLWSLGFLCVCVWALTISSAIETSP